MDWWGKLIGGTFGFMLGGPLGALLGTAIGHNFDKGLQGIQYRGNYTSGDPQRVKAAFFTATFYLMGHVCKADGRVTPDEIKTARQIMSQMQLSSEQRKAAIVLFNQGKNADFVLEEIMLQLRMEIGRSINIKRMFMEIQCHAIYADGVIHPAEKGLLLNVCDLLGFPRHEFENMVIAIGAQIHHQHSASGSGVEGMSMDDAYKILNIPTNATKEEVKRAYRRLTSQHHPDKLVSKGLPEEMMKVAAERTHEIRQAYEKINQSM
jgi:DnaJ like chaperone protein